MGEQRKVLEEKLQLQRAKNRLRELQGVVVETLLDKDNALRLDQLLTEYLRMSCPVVIPPKSRLPMTAEEDAIAEWLVTTLGLEAGAGVLLQLRGTLGQAAAARAHDSSSEPVEAKGRAGVHGRLRAGDRGSRLSARSRERFAG